MKEISKEAIVKKVHKLKGRFALMVRQVIFKTLIAIANAFLRTYLFICICGRSLFGSISEIYVSNIHEPMKGRWKVLEGEMVGVMQKGVEAAKFTKPSAGVYEGVDLKILPKYISFRAALLHNKLTQQYIILILLGLLVGHFIISRAEMYSLYGKLREKEYILAPGVQDFTPASPQSVPDSYVASAVIEFLGLLGNVASTSIDDQYAALSEAMSSQLRIKFFAEAAEWKAKVKSEIISELLSIKEKEIRSSQDGYYHVLAITRRDTYINNEYIGHADEAIEMVMQLVPPKSGKRWYLQIESLSRQSVESYKAKKNL